MRRVFSEFVAAAETMSIQGKATRAGYEPQVTQTWSKARHLRLCKLTTPRELYIHVRQHVPTIRKDGKSSN